MENDISKFKVSNFAPLILTSIFGFSIFLWTSFSSGKEINVKNSPILPSPPLLNIEEKIQEGISLLKSSLPLEYQTKNGKPTGSLVKKQIALAILDKTTGKVFEKRVWVKEDEIKNYKKTGSMTFEPALANEELDIQPKWWNSFNTFYEVHPVKSFLKEFDEVKDGPDLVVIANKYLLPSDYIVGLPERSKAKYTEIIYVPYSESLHLPEIIAAGKQYLDGVVNQAFGQLESARTTSRSLPGRPVTAAVTRDFIKNIILVEHTDPDSFLVASDEKRKELTERVLVILGANRNFAYRYTGSPAGASGLAQFIKSTYRTIVSKYPDAHLIKDYNLGMADHINAVKAMVLFFDNYKKEIDNKITRRDAISQIGITEEMLAAAYNAGPTKVVKSVNKYGLAWISSQLNLAGASSIFRNETLDYIKKFRLIKSLGLF
jgi:hypothetical protein